MCKPKVMQACRSRWWEREVQMPRLIRAVHRLHRLSIVQATTNATTPHPISVGHFVQNKDDPKSPNPTTTEWYSQDQIDVVGPLMTSTKQCGQATAATTNVACQRCWYTHVVSYVCIPLMMVHTLDDAACHCPTSLAMSTNQVRCVKRLANDACCWLVLLWQSM